MFITDLQCVIIGPESCGVMVLTRLMNSKSGVGWSGTPWSGQAVNWNCRTSLLSAQQSCVRRGNKQIGYHQIFTFDGRVVHNCNHIDVITIYCLLYVLVICWLFLYKNNLIFFNNFKMTYHKSHESISVLLPKYNYTQYPPQEWKRSSP